MKTFKVNRDSWHYRFQDAMEVDPWQRTDFCSYWRGFVIACIMATFFTALSVSMVVWIAWTSYLIGDVLSYYSMDLPLGFDGYLLAIVQAFSGLTVMAVIAYVIWLLSGVGIRGKSRNDETKQPGLFKTKYQSWKDRVCYKVEFHD
jgi:hypothetical protein